MLNFNDICWHDGVLIGFGWQTSKNLKMQTQLDIEVRVYKSHDCPEKLDLKMRFLLVKSFIFVCDSVEMEDNFGAGNINNAYSRDENVYRMQLIDGYIEIVADKISISES